jgi:hypothetical protein
MWRSSLKCGVAHYVCRLGYQRSQQPIASLLVSVKFSESNWGILSLPLPPPTLLCIAATAFDIALVAFFARDAALTLSLC